MKSVHQGRFGVQHLLLEFSTEAMRRLFIGRVAKRPPLLFSCSRGVQWALDYPQTQFGAQRVSLSEMHKDDEKL